MEGTRAGHPPARPRALAAAKRRTGLHGRRSLLLHPDALSSGHPAVCPAQPAPHPASPSSWQLRGPW